MQRAVLAVLVALILASADGAWTVQAQSPQRPSWLDGPIVNWNTPGMNIPKAPAQRRWGGLPAICPEEPVALDTPEGHAVGAAGWLQVSELARGWGQTVIFAQHGSDGMCRPIDFQVFVFVDGKFAGSVAPSPMSSRVDGSGEVAWIGSEGVVVRYTRYAQNDPLCCPSRPSVDVLFTVDRDDPAPVLFIAHRR